MAKLMMVDVVDFDDDTFIYQLKASSLVSPQVRLVGLSVNPSQTSQFASCSPEM